MTVANPPGYAIMTAGGWRHLLPPMQPTPAPKPLGNFPTMQPIEAPAAVTAPRPKAKRGRRK